MSTAQTFDISGIIEVVITLISAVLTGFFIPWIKTKLSAEKSEKLKFWVGVAVKAAEQLYGSKTGQQKKDYVISFLLSKGIVVDVDEINTLIESEVYNLTNGTTKTDETAKAE